MILSLKLYASVFLEKVIYPAPAGPNPGTNTYFFFWHTIPHIICEYAEIAHSWLSYTIIAKKILEIFNKVADQLALWQRCFWTA